MPALIKKLGVMMRVELIVAVLFAPFAAMAQPITAAERNDAIRSGFAGCMRSQIAKIENAQAYTQLIEKYCACFANKQAARLTRQELSEFEGNKGLATEHMITFAENIGNECKAELGLR